MGVRKHKSLTTVEKTQKGANKGINRQSQASFTSATLDGKKREGGWGGAAGQGSALATKSEHIIQQSSKPDFASAITAS